jgi:hypothetical protein
MGQVCLLKIFGKHHPSSGIAHRASPLSVEEQRFVSLSLLIPGPHRLTGIFTEVDHSACPILLSNPEKNLALRQTNITDPSS